MNRLIAELSRGIREYGTVVRAKSSGDEPGLRRLFHGPPLLILEQVLEELITEGGIEARLASGRAVIVPVLLQVEKLGHDETNPDIGASGRCDDAHLLALRNSPSCPRFVALVAPGHHRNLSVASAMDQFGLSASSNVGGATIDDWWQDEFVQGLVSTALDRHQWSSKGRTEATDLLESAVRAGDEADRYSVDRLAGVGHPFPSPLNIRSDGRV